MSTRILVYAQTENIIDAKDEIQQQSIVSSVLQNTPIADDFVTNIMSGNRLKFNKAYRYGLTTYTWGLPSGAHVTATGDEAAVKAAIESDVGQTVTLLSHIIDTSVADTMAREIMQKEGWDVQGDNLINNPPDVGQGGLPTYFEYATINNTVSDVVDSISIYIGWDDDGNPNTPNESSAVNLSGYDMFRGENYYYATYQIAGDPVIYYWSYRVSNGRHPELDIDVDVGQPYYPVVPIRYQGENMTSDDRIGDSLYDTSKYLLGLVGVDYKQLGISIHGDENLTEPEKPRDLVVTNYENSGTTKTLRISTDDPYPVLTFDGDVGVDPHDEVAWSSNFEDDKNYWIATNRPKASAYNDWEASEGKKTDVSDINAAFVIFGVQLSTEKEYSYKYLFAYFDYLRERDVWNKADYNAWYAGDKRGLVIPPENGVVIKTTNSGYDTRLKYHYIEKETIKGKIGKITTFEKRIVVKGHETIAGYRVDNSVLYLMKQISETHYERITVHGLYHTNWIYGVNHQVITYLEDIGDTSLEGNFVIPLHRFAIKNIPALDETNVYYDACKMVIQSIQKVKLKWYETDQFARLIKVIGIAITVISLGTAFQATAAAQGAIEALKQVTLNLVTNFAIAYGLAMVAQEFGVAAAAVVAIGLAILSINQNYDNALSQLVSDIPYAEEFLKATASVASEFNDVVKKEIADLATLGEQEKADYEEELDELKELQDELNGVFLNPMLFVNRPLMNSNESPDDYYHRTIHAGNIGVKSLDAISYYVDRRLQLPEPNENLEA